MTRSNIQRILTAGSAVLALSCDTARVAGPLADARTLTRSEQGITSSARPFSCPTKQASSSTAEVGPLGGLLTAGGMSVSIPAGALLSTVTVTLTVPASNNVEIDVSVAGTEHFVFEQPIVVTMSYARCARSNIDLAPISAWYFDPATGKLLEQMPGVDDKLLRTVTFSTGHLSGYILAN